MNSALKCVKTKTVVLNYENVTKYYCFYSIIYQVSVVLVSKRLSKQQGAFKNIRKSDHKLIIFVLDTILRLGYLRNPRSLKEGTET